MQSLKNEQKELERQKKISFLSGQRRQIFPADLPKDRLGAGLSIQGDVNLGPARYNVDEKTGLDYRSKHKLTSVLGYSLAARTGPRIVSEAIDKVPGPGAYEIKNTIRIHNTSQKKVPFLTKAARLQSVITTANETVGPGYYNHELDRNRHVVWEGTFGDGPKNLPNVDHESFIPSNTNKLLSTVENRRFNRRLAYLKLYYGKEGGNYTMSGKERRSEMETKSVVSAK